MSGRRVPGPANSARVPEPLAAAAVLVWAAAAWLTRSYGIWLPIGSVAVVLAAVGVAIAGRALPGRTRWSVGLGLGTLAGLVMTLGTALLYEPVTTLVPVLRADAARLHAAFSAPGPLAALAVLPLVVIAEEVVWRGLVHAALARRLPPDAAGAVGVVLYTLVLLPTASPALILTAFVAGSCWTFLRVRVDSLAAAVTAHLVWDLLVLVVQVRDLS